MGWVSGGGECWVSRTVTQIDIWPGAWGWDDHAIKKCHGIFNDHNRSRPECYGSEGKNIRKQWKIPLLNTFLDNDMCQLFFCPVS